MKILGLDLGVASIGWALIDTDGDKYPVDILALGSRIVNLRDKEANEFASGKGETPCSQRTVTRTMRKSTDRYQQRRALLASFLNTLGMIDHDNRMTDLSPIEIWQLRADAATPGKQISLTELGRVLMHLNQKRGYRHAKTDGNDTKQTAYVADVNRRYAELHETGLTIGQYFAGELKKSEVTGDNGSRRYTFRIKDRVYPRKTYMEEFDAIMDVQSGFYPSILSPETIAAIKNIIFYQRPLKSCKHLVSRCEFQKYIFRRKDGTEVATGPKVAPRTSPIAQATAVYEAINNLRLVNNHNRKKAKPESGVLSLFDEASASMPRDARLMQHEYVLTPEERQRLFVFLNTHEKMSATDLLRELGLKKADGFKPDKAFEKGRKGNSTYCAIAKAIDGYPQYRHLLDFRMDVVDTRDADPDTGEIIREVSPSVTHQPLYELWHTLYSISDSDELAKVLKAKFGIEEDEVIARLCAIDFVTPGYCNRSAKFMRKLFPYLMDGLTYSEAATMAGVNHSGSITKEENEQRELKDRLSLLAPNSMRQPTVEKVLNQMINVVNALLDKYGYIDEIRVELARELKQSKEERQKRTDGISKREKDNKRVAEIIESHGVKASRNKIQKYLLWEESGKTCMYCGKTLNLADFLSGDGVETEHIIPRSLFFDDSFSNKVCSCRDCNKEKNNRTAYDYMESKGETELQKYITRVEDMCERKVISHTKRMRLMTAGKDIPSDFLLRDLRLTQYVSKKAIQILREVCRDVWASSGSVTDFFRHAWGYDEILHDLNLERYELGGLVKEETYEHEGQTHTRKRIEGWNKRLDHRHHAIDALTVALTRQGYIQRLNNLNTEHNLLLSDLETENVEFRRRHKLLEQWAESRPHFEVSDVAGAVDAIAVSFKPGKKLITLGRRAVRKGKGKKIVQTGITVPRGALHQESVYGRIKVFDDAPKTLRYAFENHHLIADSFVREQIETLHEATGGDWKNAQKLLRKSPVTLPGHDGPVKEVKCFRDEIVIRYDVSGLKRKDLEWIVDPAVKEAVAKRFAECGDNDKKFAQSITPDNPIYLDDKKTVPIRKVRCFTGLKPDKVVAVKKDSHDNPIGYAKTANNHHVAFYQTPEGSIETCVPSFWNCVKRKRYGLPIVVKDPAEAWDILANLPDSADVDELAQSLPSADSTFLFSMQMNEMFVIGMSDDEWNDAISSHDSREICKHLYRVQKLAPNNYVFRYQLATNVNIETSDKLSKMYYLLASFKALKEANIRKVKVNILGEITPADD